MIGATALTTRGGEPVLVDGASSPVRVSVDEVRPAPQSPFHSRGGAPLVYLDTDWTPFDSLSDLDPLMARARAHPTPDGFGARLVKHLQRIEELPRPISAPSSSSSMPNSLLAGAPRRPRARNAKPAVTVLLFAAK